MLYQSVRPRVHCTVNTVKPWHPSAEPFSVRPAPCYPSHPSQPEAAIDAAAPPGILRHPRALRLMPPVTLDSCPGARGA